MNVITANNIYMKLFQYNFYFLTRSKISVVFVLLYFFFLIILGFSQTSFDLQNPTISTANLPLNPLSQFFNFLSLFYFFTYIFPFALFLALYKKRNNSISTLLFHYGNYYVVSDLLFVFILYLTLFIPCLLIILARLNSIGGGSSDVFLFMQFYGSNFLLSFLYLTLLVLLSIVIKNKLVFFVIHFMNLPLVSFDESRFWIPINWGFTVFRYFETTFRKMLFFEEYPPMLLIAYFVLIYTLLLVLLLKLISNVQTKTY